jgi:hypothetical protein
VVVAIGVLWCLLPLWLLNRTPADAVGIIVAGELIDEAPDQIYSEQGLGELPPLAQERTCAFFDKPGDCSRNSNPFVSPPAAIPLAGAIATLSDDAGIALIRLVAVAAAVGALVLLWRDHGRAPGFGPAAVAVSAVAVTPIVIYSVSLGQTSSLFLLAAVAGPPTLAGRGLVSSLAWGGLIAMKFFPAFAVVGVRGRKSASAVVAIGIALVALTVLGGWWAGWSRLGEFVTATRAVAADARATASSGGIETVARDLFGQDQAGTVALGLRVVAAVALLGACRRLRDPGITWAAALFFTVFAVPQVWTHYLLVIPGLGAAAAHRAGARALVLGSIATVPAMFALDAGGLTLSYVVAATLVLSAGGFVAWAFTGRSREAAEPADEMVTAGGELQPGR